MWGVTGFGKLGASSTARVLGGGNASNTFLRDLSELIGDYQYTERSTTHHSGGTSRNVTRPSERIMDVADLAALSLGRMVVFASGCRPTLVRAVPWWKDKAWPRSTQMPRPRPRLEPTRRRTPMLPERLPITEVPEHLPEFVDHVLLPTLTSGRPKTVWCLEWREHPDAVAPGTGRGD